MLPPYTSKYCVNTGECNFKLVTDGGKELFLVLIRKLDPELSGLLDVANLNLTVRSRCCEEARLLFAGSGRCSKQRVDEQKGEAVLLRCSTYNCTLYH